ncbi:response regulator [Candidatus Bipolaricaulota bacterium]|nr:response regulator [Candidatus Bipolaricaulota bacterium]
MIEEGEEFSIFLIEDREEDIDITREALKEADRDCELEVVKEGETALSKLKERSRKKSESFPDIILLDLNLPKMDGRKVLQELKEDDKLSPIPVIVLTVSKRDEDIAKSYDSGAAGYITKPIDFSEFVKTINVVNKYWSINELPGRN